MTFSMPVMAAQHGGGGTSSPTPTPTPAVSFVMGFNDGTGTTETLSHTTTALDGQTPKAALFFGAAYPTSGGGTEDPEANFMIGYADGTTQASFGCYSRVGDSVTRDVTIGYDDYGMRAVVYSSNRSVRGNITLKTEGMDVAYDSGGAGVTEYTALFFAGTGVQAHGGRLDLNTSPQDVTDPGFEPDIVFTFGNSTAMNSVSAVTRFSVNFGIAVNDGSATQRSIAFREENFQAAGAIVGALLTDAAHGVMTGGGSLSTKSVISTFDSSGFTQTPTNASTGVDAFYLAVKLDGKQFKLVDLTTPTSTGSQAITGAGFTPSFALVVLTSLETTDSFPGATSANQSGFSISLLTSSEQWTHAARLRSGAANPDNAKLSLPIALLGATDTACDTIKATLTSFDSDGMTLNYSAVAGTGKKGFILFVE